MAYDGKTTTKELTAIVEQHGDRRSCATEDPPQNDEMFRATLAAGRRAERLI